MKPKPQRATKEQPLIGWRLDMVLDSQQELFRLAAVIDWASLEKEFGTLYCADNGRPGVPIRLMAGLHLLKHAYGLSDEEVVQRWVQNPYDQYFCGEEFFQHELPINPSQMTRWRKRIGEAGCEKLLKLTIDTGIDQRTVVSGIAEYYNPEEIIGQQVSILVNLEPKELKGIKSQGMILMAQDADGSLKFVTPTKLLIMQILQ